MSPPFDGEWVGTRSRSRARSSRWPSIDARRFVLRVGLTVARNVHIKQVSIRAARAGDLRRVAAIRDACGAQTRCMRGVCAVVLSAPPAKRTTVALCGTSVVVRDSTVTLWA
ncbi:hypothetical protein BCEP4_1860024 [Burkholderia cepacia]|nr:hypothetical protein BCEP4_1860024 [Burkholderia cepacia]